MGFGLVSARADSDDPDEQELERQREELRNQLLELKSRMGYLDRSLEFGKAGLLTSITGLAVVLVSAWVSSDWGLGLGIGLTLGVVLTRMGADAIHSWKKKEVKT